MSQTNPSCLDSPSLQEQVRALGRPAPLRFTVHLITCWAIILGCGWCWRSYPRAWLWPILALLVASRQHALGLLAHDVAHRRYFRPSSVADWVCNLTMAFPLLYNVQNYRAHHLDHHLFLNTKDDPDWVQKNGRRAYATPMSRGRFVRRVIFATLGGGLYEMVRYLKFIDRKELREKVGPWPGIGMLIYLVALIAILYQTSLLRVYLAIWLVPGFTFLLAFIELRDLTEHVGFVDDGSLFTRARSIHLSWIEGFLLNPFNSNYHLEHHLYPNVPFFHLARLHRALMATPGFVGAACVTRGYFGAQEASTASELARAPAVTPTV